MLINFFRDNFPVRAANLLALALFLSACQTMAPEDMRENTQTKHVPEHSETPLAKNTAEKVAVNVAVFDEERSHSASQRRLFSNSLQAMEESRYEDAVDLLLALTIDAPHLSSPWTNLGIAYLKLDDSVNANSAFEQAVVRNPSNCVALNQLGVMARTAGDFDKAESHYLACARQVPQFSEVHLNLGILYELYMGKYAAALSEYRTYQALLVTPDKRIAGWVMDLERRGVSLIATRVQ